MLALISTMRPGRATASSNLVTQIEKKQSKGLLLIRKFVPVLYGQASSTVQKSIIAPQKTKINSDRFLMVCRGLLYCLIN